MNFIEKESAQKLRGGYYTPLDLATFIARWIKEIGPKQILEPSCGDGIFFEALAKVRGFKRSGVPLGMFKSRSVNGLLSQTNLLNAAFADESYAQCNLRNFRNIEQVSYNLCMGLAGDPL